jgi:hypothetical protein
LSLVLGRGTQAIAHGAGAVSCTSTARPKRNENIRGLSGYHAIDLPRTQRTSAFHSRTRPRPALP